MSYQELRSLHEHAASLWVLWGAFACVVAGIGLTVLVRFLRGLRS